MKGDNAFPSEPVRMADVARAAGVHQSTVSLALRNDVRLPEATRERIAALARQMGYRPNPLISALISERKRKQPNRYGGTLAFLTSFPTEDGWRRPTYLWQYEELVKSTNQAGYLLEIFWMRQPNLSSQRLRDILLARGIRGVLVAPPPGLEQSINFDFTDFAAVEMGHHVKTPRLDHVAVDYFALIQTLVSKLQSGGCRRIGFATRHLVDVRTDHRLLGSYLAARMLAKGGVLAPLVSPDWWEQTQVRTWIERNRPDAIIVTGQADFDFFQAQLEAMKIAIPDDVSLLSINCSRETSAAGMSENVEKMAMAAVQLLTSKVERAFFGVPQEPQSILIGSHWKAGWSARPEIGT